MNTLSYALSFERLIYTVPAILIAMTLHEMAHGFVSYKLGDPTPKEDGRLSLNPFRHLDPLGALCMLLFGFGWAKPVMVDSRYYDDEKTGMMWTAIAGPLMNIIVAFVMLLLSALIMNVSSPWVIASNDVLGYLYRLCIITAQLNISLGIFNLIPLPPLDGSKVLASLLPDQLYYKVLANERYFAFGLFILLYMGVFNTPLMNATNSIFSAMMDMIYNLFGLL